MKLTEKCIAILIETERLGRINPQQAGMILRPDGRKEGGHPFRAQGLGYLGGGYLGKLRKLGLLRPAGKFDEIISYWSLTPKALLILQKVRAS